MILAAAAPSSFVVITWVVGAVLSVAGLIMGIMGYNKAGQRAEKTDLVTLERRLVTLEEKTRSSPDISDRLVALEQRIGSSPQILERITTTEAIIRQVSTDISRAASLSDRIVALETKMDVFWKGIAIDAAKMLHQPHPEFARRDYLLEQFTFDKLTKAEAKELADALMPVWKESNTAAERIAAGILLRTLRVEFSLDIKLPYTIGHPKEPEHHENS